MSIRLMSAIFETEFFDLQDGEGNNTKASTAKFVVLALADHANDDGEGAYPSLERLSRKTSLSRPCVINAIDALKFNGIIRLEGESKRGTNNYSIDPNCFSKGVNGSQPRLLVNPVDGGSKPGLPVLVNPVYPNHHLTITESPAKTEKPDIMDGILKYSKPPKSEEDVETTLVRLEQGLKINIDRSLKNQSIAKWILKQEKEGETLEKWLKWCKSDEWRLAHLYLYADLGRIRTEWPQAFVRQSAPLQPEKTDFQKRMEERGLWKPSS